MALTSLLLLGLVTLDPNPHHRRAHLVVLSEAGRIAYDEAMERQFPWVESLVKGIGQRDIEAAHRVISALRRRLEVNEV